MSAGKLDLRPWILFPREENLRCISCVVLFVNKTHECFTYNISPVCSVILGFFYMGKFWLFPFLIVLGCSIYAEVCHETKESPEN